MRRRESRRTATCGMLCALAVVVMLLGTTFPLATYCAPALAGLCVLPAALEFGTGSGVLLYLISGLLSLLLCPDVEAAGFFVVLLGYYPLLKLKLDRIRRRPLRILAKLGVFNAATAALYTVLLVVFPLPALQADLAGASLWMGGLLLLMGNLTFLVYDAALVNIIRLYLRRLRPLLFGKNRG